MPFFCVLRAVLNAIVTAIVWPLVELGSNRILLAGIVLITVTWVLNAQFAHHPWDDWKAGLPRLVLWYTLWWGLVEGATKVVQADQARRDRKRDAEMKQLLELNQQQLAGLTDLTVALKEELDRAREREQQQLQLLTDSALREQATLETMNRVLDAIDVKGGEHV